MAFPFAALGAALLGTAARQVVKQGVKAAAKQTAKKAKKPMNAEQRHAQANWARIDTVHKKVARQWRRVEMRGGKSGDDAMRKFKAAKTEHKYTPRHENWLPEIPRKWQGEMHGWLPRI